MAYVARRLVALVPVWLLITALAFGLSALAPGDPAVVALRRQTGEVPSAEAVARYRHQLHLDEPVPLRYGRWVAGAARGDFGRSIRTGEPVFGALAGRFVVTLQIAVPAMVLSLLLAIPLGVVTAVFRNSLVDHTARAGALLGASIPSYWLGYMLILLFAVTWKVLPVAGRGGWQHVVLPTVTLALGAAASLTRLTRASVLEVLGLDYVQTARAKGARERLVVGSHALRNALVPVVTLAGIRFGHLLAGAVIVETVFAWPGIGSYVVASIYDRDYPTIQGFVLLTGTVFLLVNLLVDLLYVRLDPRVRLGGRR